MSHRRTLRLLRILTLSWGAVLMFQGAAVAQSSASYRLSEHSFNAGGRPAQGVVSSSAGFRLTLDSIGDPTSYRDFAGMSFKVDGGFTPAYAPPGEVLDLDLLGDLETLVWSWEAGSATYNVYSGAIATLPGSYGGCAMERIAANSWADPTIPAQGGGLFYLVTGENLLWQEGTKGWDTNNVERNNSLSCP